MEWSLLQPQHTHLYPQGGVLKIQVGSPIAARWLGGSGVHDDMDDRCMRWQKSGCILSWPHTIPSLQTLADTMNGPASTSTHHSHPKEGPQIQAGAEMLPMAGCFERT